MALAFVTVNSTNNAVVFAGSNLPFQPNRSYFTTIADDADPYIKDLLSNVNAHTFDIVMTGKPYVVSFYDGANLHINLMNPPATVPTTASVSFLGQAFSTSIVNNASTFPITIHPAVSEQRVTASVKIDGFPLTSIELAGSNGNAPSQVYRDSNNVCQIVPQNNSDLANYWQNNFVDMAWSEADLATITGLLAHTLFHYVLPNMNLTLTTAEQNGLKDVQNNILPSIASNLTNIIPDGVTDDIHYNSYKLHVQQAKQAMDKYVADRVEISKYITLK
jgi:hypothetical protein